MHEKAERLTGARPASARGGTGRWRLRGRFFLRRVTRSSQFASSSLPESPSLPPGVLFARVGPHLAPSPLCFATVPVAARQLPARRRSEAQAKGRHVEFEAYV